MKRIKFETFLIAVMFVLSMFGVYQSANAEDVIYFDPETGVETLIHESDEEDMEGVDPYLIDDPYIEEESCEEDEAEIEF